MSKTVKMKHPTACSFSHEGVEVVADKKGMFAMPADMVAAAVEHGFVEHSGKGGNATDKDDADDKGDDKTDAEGNAEGGEGEAAK